MRVLRLLLAVPLAIASSAGAASDPDPKFTGKWHNSLCSEMEIASVDLKAGTIAGTYRTGVGKPGPADVFPLAGFVNGDLIAFTVNWGKPISGQAVESLTSWAGQHTSAGSEEYIKTFWNLAVNAEDASEADSLWRANWSGSDHFERGPVPVPCVKKP
jgi:hypothetical protein